MAFFTSGERPVYSDLEIGKVGRWQIVNGKANCNLYILDFINYYS